MLIVLKMAALFERPFTELNVSHSPFTREIVLPVGYPASLCCLFCFFFCFKRSSYDQQERVIGSVVNKNAMYSVYPQIKLLFQRKTFRYLTFRCMSFSAAVIVPLGSNHKINYSSFLMARVIIDVTEEKTITQTEHSL